MAIFLKLLNYLNFNSQLYFAVRFYVYFHIISFTAWMLPTFTFPITSIDLQVISFLNKKERLFVWNIHQPWQVGADSLALGDSKSNLICMEWTKSNQATPSEGTFLWGRREM